MSALKCTSFCQRFCVPHTDLRVLVQWLILCKFGESRWLYVNEVLIRSRRVHVYVTNCRIIMRSHELCKRFASLLYVSQSFSQSFFLLLLLTLCHSLSFYPSIHQSIYASIPICPFILLSSCHLPSPMAQSVALPAWEQEVAGSIPGLASTLATGFIPISPLSVVSTMPVKWETSQWLGKNIVRSTG